VAKADRASRPDCPLCSGAGGRVLAETRDFRVVWPDEPGCPGLLRVIWSSHAAEMTDLSADERVRLMDAVWRVEGAMRRVLAPDKINLASLGNMVPHLHWHVVPRWRGDRHFPASIWGEPQAEREVSARAVDREVRAQLDLLLAEVARAFAPI
jgi:diadenosine tetraphosphate (Ap4A) HIT family hydrolase